MRIRGRNRQSWEGRGEEIERREGAVVELATREDAQDHKQVERQPQIAAEVSQLGGDARAWSGRGGGGGLEIEMLLPRM